MAAVRQRVAAAERRRKLENMFDPQVIERMRAEFDAADADGSGSIDTAEATAMLGRLQISAGASPGDLRRSAEALLRDVDADRNGEIDFEEFCFRFGRRYQMEIAAERRRKSGFPERTDTRARHVDEDRDEGARDHAGIVNSDQELLGQNWSRGQVLGVILVVIVAFAFIYAHHSASAENWRHAGGRARGSASSSRTRGYRPR